MGRFHDLAGAVQNDTLHAPPPQVAERRADLLLDSLQMAQDPGVVLVAQASLVLLTVVRHYVGVRTHRTIEHADVAGRDHVVEKPVHRRERQAEATRKRPLRDVRAPLELEDQLLTELSARSLIGPLQDSRSWTWEYSVHRPTFML